MFGRFIGIALMAMTLSLSLLGPPDLEAAPRVKSCPHCGTLYSGSLARGTYTEYSATAPAAMIASSQTYITTAAPATPVVKWRPVRQFYYVTTSPPSASSTSTQTATASGRCTCPGCNCDAKSSAVGTSNPDGSQSSPPPMATATSPPQ